MGRFFYFIFIIVLCEESFGNELRQEGAVVKCCNPKYVTNCSAITRRIKRGEPYRTNITSVLLVPVNNNATLHISYGIKGAPNMLSVKTKICEITHIKWIKEYFRNFSNVPMKCPVMPGSYGFFNMEFPPKNFPLPIPNEDIYMTFSMEVTDTKELLIEIEAILRSVQIH